MKHTPQIREGDTMPPPAKHRRAENRGSRRKTRAALSDYLGITIVRHTKEIPDEHSLDR